MSIINLYGFFTVIFILIIILISFG